MEENIQKPQETNTPPPPPSSGNIPAHSPMPKVISKKLIFLILGFLILLIGISAGTYFLGKNSNKQTPTPAPDQKACSQEAKICPDGSAVGRTGPNCEFAACPISNSTIITNYSSFLDKIKTLTTASSYNSLIEMQSTDEIECDPGADYIFSICEGASKGEIKTGYWLGRNQSEGSILPKTEYVNEIKNLFDLYAPFTIVGEKESGNRALIVFRGKPVQGTDTMIAFQAKDKDGWKISTIIYGPLTQEYEKLDNSLFNF